MFFFIIKVQEQVQEQNKKKEAKMSKEQFSQPPYDVSVGKLTPFTFSVSDEEIKTLQAFLAQPLPRASFENATAQLEGFGVSRAWLAEAVEAWKGFDW